MLEPSAELLLSEALALLTAALDLIDRAEPPGDIGAHVDFAMQRIKQVLGRSTPLDGDMPTT